MMLSDHGATPKEWDELPPTHRIYLEEAWWEQQRRRQEERENQQ